MLMVLLQKMYAQQQSNTFRSESCQWCYCRKALLISGPCTQNSWTGYGGLVQMVVILLGEIINRSLFNVCKIISITLVHSFFLQLLCTKSVEILIWTTLACPQKYPLSASSHLTAGGLDLVSFCESFGAFFFFFKSLCCSFSRCSLSTVWNKSDNSFNWCHIPCNPYVDSSVWNKPGNSVNWCHIPCNPYVDSPVRNKPGNSFNWCHIPCNPYVDSPVWNKPGNSFNWCHIPCNPYVLSSLKRTVTFDMETGPGVTCEGDWVLKTSYLFTCEMETGPGVTGC